MTSSAHMAPYSSLSGKPKAKPLKPGPIKIRDTEAEEAFWAAMSAGILDMDTPANSSCVSSAVPSSVASSRSPSQDAYIESDEEETHTQLKNGSSSSPIVIQQSQTQEATASAKLDLPGLLKQKTKMVAPDETAINDPSTLQNDADDGYVANGLHIALPTDDDEENGKKKAKLPSPTAYTNSLAEIAMWKLLKERKKSEKRRESESEEEEEEEEEEETLTLKQKEESNVVISSIDICLCSKQTKVNAETTCQRAF
mmetsp:Transcript_43396/g.69537  ORF Transcript_43396/g.69537 Transcript_43396/m.69537 type:complete len:255 (-) Transcript_43396:178-942(-)|eukprot:CAMPEP_0197038332 /NCGR_PEP_ID=MMETSP1384-20130603/15288_1 /TAXON_ID=29189 /ORGANISM="Ammonia sp." /LENGTH=254 /DNA_ID=CAMNT_0042468747 /DNA_START=101 /DNA_END=865 /DNA_ORIENTATION=-